MFYFTEAVVNDISGENKAGAADVSASQHVMVCALKELGSLVQSLSATASPLIQEPSIGETNRILNETFVSVSFMNTSWIYIDSNTPAKHIVYVICCELCKSYISFFY